MMWQGNHADLAVVKSFYEAMDSVKYTTSLTKLMQWATPIGITLTTVL